MYQYLQSIFIFRWPRNYSNGKCMFNIHVSSSSKHTKEGKLNLFIFYTNIFTILAIAYGAKHKKKNIYVDSNVTLILN